MTFNLEFVGFYNYAQPKSHFLQHMHSLKYVKCVGTITLQSLETVMLKQWADDPALLASAKDFIEFQISDGGADMSSRLYTAETEDEVTIVHFDAVPE
jgi:hypothetical protein